MNHKFWQALITCKEKKGSKVYLMYFNFRTYRQDEVYRNGFLLQVLMNRFASHGRVKDCIERQYNVNINESSLDVTFTELKNEPDHEPMNVPLFSSDKLMDVYVSAAKRKDDSSVKSKRQKKYIKRTKTHKL